MMLHEFTTVLDVPELAIVIMQSLPLTLQEVT